MITPQKPIDMANPSINDIYHYEIYCVQTNKWMTTKERDEKVAQLLGEMTQSKGN